MADTSRMTDEMLDNFCSVTGASKERARFYLEASNGDLDAAIGNFFEGGGANEEIESSGGIPAHHGFGQQDENEEDDDDDDDLDFNPNPLRFGGAAAASSKPDTRKPTTRSKPETGKIFTLRDAAGDEDQEEEDDKGQAFYAGGSETSGQQILGPSRKKADNIITDLFKKAKEHGAREVDESEQARTSNRGPVVYGTGYRLGTGDEPSEVVRGPERPKPPKVHVLKLWKNGFTVDEGALRSYSDPANREFLDAIQKGAPPRELIRQAEGAEVNLDMQDHRDEDYVPPKGKYVLYNDGYKLGSPTPAVVSNASPQEQSNSEDAAKKEIGLDEGKPVTQVQVRLSNGTRLVIKANHSHKVSDIRRYIERARPEYKQRKFALLMSFPNKEITDEEQTLVEANLLNSVIVQKL